MLSTLPVSFLLESVEKAVGEGILDGVVASEEGGNGIPDAVETLRLVSVVDSFLLSETMAPPRARITEGAGEPIAVQTVEPVAVKLE